MRGHEWIAAVLVGLAVTGWVQGGQPAAEPELTGRWAVIVTTTPADSGSCCLSRLAPAGGWFPYGLLHWWNTDWRPRCGVPDDYCHKPLPPFQCSPCSHYFVVPRPEHDYPEKKYP